MKVLFGEVGIADATIAIIARMDEAGINPEENQSEYHNICERKKDELSLSVSGASVGKKLHAVHCVAADPYQMVGNLPNPGRELYDDGRSWDGVDFLAKEILELREHHRELRQLAGARFVRMLLADTRDELQRIAENLALNIEGADNEVKRHQLNEKRLDAMQRQARAELTKKIEDALLSVSRSVNDAGADSTKILDRELIQAIDEWAEVSFSMYAKLATQLELEIQERMARPSMDGFQFSLPEGREPKASERRPEIFTAKTGKKFLSFGPVLRKSWQKYAEADLGMTLKSAADRLKEIELSGKTVEEYIKSQSKKKLFRSVEQADKAAKYVEHTKMFDVFGPLVEQLGGVLFEVGADVMSAKQAEHCAQQREELRAKLREEAKRLEDQVSADFDTTCSGLRHWLSQRLSVINSSREGLSDQLDSLNCAIGLLEKHLEIHN